MTTRWRNWAGNQTADPRRVARPRTAAEVAEVISQAASEGERVKATGSGHSFTPIAATDGVLVDLGLLSGVNSADPGTGRVWVRGGTPLHVLNRELAERGLSMTNLGDIDRQTITGALATGTHGTGARLGGLATQISAIEIALADGSIVTCDRETEPELFDAARVGLGALGIITAVELRCEPEYALTAQERPLPLPEVLDRIQDLADENDHFEFYWFPYTDVALTKINNRLPRDATRSPLSPMRAWLDDDFLANTVLGAGLRLPRRWPSITPRFTRFASRLLSGREYSDTAHKVFCSPRRFRFLEAECAIPREGVAEGIARVRTILDSGRDLISMPIEVRFAAADDIPLSTASGWDSAYIAVHVFDGQPHQAYFAEVEDALADLGARPHWGKLHGFAADDLRRAYPRFDDFLDVRGKVDPEGRFGNAYLDRVLGPPVTPRRS